ncbi:MAG: DNA-binding response regulator [Betaproteobacteria bacterium]|jgi:DNA-binding response OmpR family regulator|nr:DNA-binding response regulator [Betaproteobacteria bacterium]
MPKTINRIVLVEDNIALREALEDHLTNSGFDVQGVGDGNELNLALASAVPHVVVLDLNLPEEDGLSIAKRLRKAFPQIGIVMLTARVRSIDRHEGYESGADIYLTKPVKPMELTTVLQTLCRRMAPAAATPAWLLRMSSLQIEPPGHPPILLTVSEANLVYELALSGDLLSMSRLIELFGDIDLPEATNKLRIEQIVSRVRRKLDAVLQGQPAIKAVTRMGYKLFVPVHIE